MAGHWRPEATALVSRTSRTRDIDRYLQMVREAWRTSGQDLNIAAIILGISTKQMKRWLKRAGIERVAGRRRPVIPLIQRTIDLCCGDDAHGTSARRTQGSRSRTQP